MVWDVETQEKIVNITTDQEITASCFVPVSLLFFFKGHENVTDPQGLVPTIHQSPFHNPFV